MEERSSEDDVNASDEAEADDSGWAGGLAEDDDMFELA